MMKRLNPVFPVKFNKADWADRYSKSRIKANPMARVIKGKMPALKTKTLSGRHFGSARVKAAYPRYTGISRERIPKDLAKNFPTIPGKTPIPNKTENMEKHIKNPQRPRKTASQMAIVRNLKDKSELNLDLISILLKI